MRRYGQLYGAAVLRPFAEQLANALDVEPGQTVCDLLCDGGELTRVLALRVAPDGRVFAADVVDAGGCSDSVESGIPRGIVATVELRDGVVPIADRTCAAVGVLFTAGFAAALRSEAARVCLPGGRALAAVWDPQNPPAHEHVLDAALQTVARYDSEYLRAVLAVPAGSAGVSVTVGDVVRFDGFAHYWAAMVRERPLMDELSAALPEVAVREVQDVSRAALGRYAAADGTLRIPVSANLMAL
jgi:SAM-dependent methyltransferase